MAVFIVVPPYWSYLTLPHPRMAGDRGNSAERPAQRRL